MTKKSPGEHAVAIHAKIAELNCLINEAGQAGLRVDVDIREVQMLAFERVPMLNVKMYQRITP